MPAPDWEDLDDFLDEDEHATRATFTHPEDDSTFDVIGIFDRAYINPNLGAYELDSATPCLTCKESDTHSIFRGMPCAVQVRIGESVQVENYLVRKVEPEGTGFAHVILEFE